MFSQLVITAYDDNSIKYTAATPPHPRRWGMNCLLGRSKEAYESSHNGRSPRRWRRPSSNLFRVNNEWMPASDDDAANNAPLMSLDVDHRLSSM